MFVSDITYPDDSVVSPGSEFIKTWRMANDGTCTWSNYKLVFTNGNQMGGPASVSVPTTAPGQTSDITVPLTAPSTGGTYRGDWQLEDDQGVYVGGKSNVWVKISVPNGSSSGGGGSTGGGGTTLSCDYCPSVVSPGQHFQPKITVHLGSGQLLESRGDMLRNVDNNLYGAWPHVSVSGTVNAGGSYTFTFYANNPVVAPSGEGTYHSVWQLWQGGSWVGPQVDLNFTVHNGGGTPPSVPTPTSPSNWYASRDGSTPQLCASSSSGNVQYDFQIHDPQTFDSGWQSGNCWTPPTLNDYTFTWHAKVRDSGTGLESDWSDDWHFTLFAQQLSMDPISFSPGSPSAADGDIKVRSCVHGFGDINLGLAYDINDATDGSSNGQWHGFSNHGDNCPNPNDPSQWGSLPSREYADGDHLIRAKGYGPHGETMIVYATYHLSHRRPQDPHVIGPYAQDGISHVGSRTVMFTWNPAINAESYELLVSPNADMSAPLFDQNVGNVTSYQYTFSRDYATVYWQLRSINTLGRGSTGAVPVDVDTVPPNATVAALPIITTDTTFSVSWSGTDNDSGVQWYNIQYCDISSPGTEWTDWKSNTTEIAGLFTGQPGHMYSFRAQAMDKAGNLSKYAVFEGDTYTSIDLNARPPTPWWNPGYNAKRNLAILNRDSQTLPAGYPIHLHFDRNTSVTASDIFNGSLAPTKGDDVRLVYQNQTELPRYVANFTSSQVDIWFDLPASIGPNPASDTVNYQLYYGNAAPSRPPGSINDILPEGTDGNTVGLWHFQEGGGSTVSDSSGNGNTGVATSMGWTDGKLGPAGIFDGHASAVNAGNSTAFNVSQLTVEAWVYPTNTNAEETIVRKTADDNSLIYDFIVQSDGVYLRLNGNNGNVKSNHQLQLNRWYHIAGTYDGSTIKVYINGVLDGSVPYSLPLRHGTSTNLYIGGDPQFSNNWFYGQIQGVRVSNIARTDFPYASEALVTTEPSNSIGSTITPPTSGTPSLAVDGVDEYPNPDGSTTLAATVRNLGSASTQNGFATDLYLNHPPSGTGDHIGSVGSWQASPVDANGAIVLTTTVPSAIAKVRAHADRASGSSVKDAVPAETSQTYYVQADSNGALKRFDDPSKTISGPITVCSAAPDAYEPSNSAASAAAITTDDQGQIHNFNRPGNQDWVTFRATFGAQYTIATSNLGPNADTVLTLYGPDGTTQLATNDDSGGTLASQIQWYATSSATYYVKVTDWNPGVGGCGTTYTLSVKGLRRPGPVSNLVMTPGDGQVTVSWGYPVDDGGSPITSYDAYLLAAGTNGPIRTAHITNLNQLPIVWTGLTNGRLYTVWITARNAVGSFPILASFTLPYVLVHNGGFESGLPPWQTTAPRTHPVLTTIRSHAGTTSASLCGYNACNGTLWQTVSVPANYGSATLTFWLYIASQETNAALCNDRLAVVLRTAGGVQFSQPLQVCNTTARTRTRWMRETVDLGSALAPYVGKLVQVAFIASNNSSLPTTFFLDDIGLTAMPTPPQLVQNGGFEAATAPWVPSGQAAVTSAQAHAGTHSVKLCGIASCRDAVSQLTAIPAGSAKLTLSYWYFVTSQKTGTACSDTMQARLQTMGGVLISAGLRPICNTAQQGKWLQVTADVTQALAAYRGRQVQLSFSGTTSAMNAATTFYLDDVGIATS